MQTMNKARSVADALLDLQIPDEVQLSPDGKQVIYTVRHATRQHKQKSTFIWVAKVGQAQSGQEIVSEGFGLCKSPQWSPCGQFAAFILESSSSGKQTGIYQLSIHADQQIYPQLLSLGSENLIKISAFAWSPCGQYVAYTCQDKEDSEDENNMPIVYGKHWKYDRLYLLKVYGGTLTAMYNQPRHVHEFVWTPDTKSLIFDTHKYPERSSPYFDGSIVYAVSIENLEVSIVCDFPGPLENLTWHQDQLYFMTMSPDPSHLVGSRALYSISIRDQSWQREAFGKESCAVKLFSTGQSLVVQIQNSLLDQLVLLEHRNEPRVISESIYGIETWHVRQVDSTLVTVQGQCFGTQEEALYPTELYSFQADSIACRLTEHGGQLSTSSLCTVKPIHTKASDGASLTGILLIPRHDSTWTSAEKSPAVVGVHGGPYVRINGTFNIPQYHWGPWLASLGYVVILPNYRGSSSQGEEFGNRGWRSSG